MSERRGKVKNKKQNQEDRYIVLVASSKNEMEKFLFFMCRFRGDNVVLSSNGKPVVPTLFKTRKEAEQKVGEQKMVLNYEKYELKDSIRHLKQHGFVQEYPGIINFVKETAAWRHGLLGTLSPVFKIVKTTQEKWDNFLYCGGENP